MDKLEINKFLFTSMSGNEFIDEFFEKKFTYEIIGEGDKGETLIHIKNLPCPRCEKNKWFLYSNEKGEEIAACLNCEKLDA